MRKEINYKITRQLLTSFLLVGLVLFFQGCDSTKLITSEKKISIDKGNITSINGRYKNIGSETLWSHLKPFFRGINSKHASSCNPSTASIEIKVLNERSIQFTYYEAQKLMETKVLRYKNKDGVILIKKLNNFSLQGIPLLFFRQQREGLNLTLDKDLNLLLSCKGSVSGGFFIIVFGDVVMGEYTYLRE